jgi:AraC-like DNA-binding protein
MYYQTFKPPESLTEFVRFFWVFESDITANNPFEHLSTASVYSKMAFQYQGGMELQQSGNETLFTSGFQAQTNQYYPLLAKQKAGVFGVYFYPYTLPLLFSIPAHEITNHTIEISILLGNQGKELEEKVVSAKSTKERLCIVSSFLEKQIAQLRISNSGIIATIQHIISQRGVVNVDDLVERNFLSQRQFGRKFKAYTGFSPKMFSRIVRFENFISSYVKSQNSLTSLAYTYGYYDQSHLIKEFREFSGQHPKAYFGEDVSLFVDS